MAGRNILSEFLRVPAPVHTLFPLLLALREVEPVWRGAAGLRGAGRTERQLQKRESSKSSSIYIMRRSKVTQGPRKREFPGGRPLLEAREAELTGQKLFQSTAPGSGEVVHLKADPRRIHALTT